MTDLAAPIQKEIRFSVIMYGGVSLAVYINGVSQEIFKMVRATARKEYLSLGKPESSEYYLTEAELTGSEKVYRQLGEHLHASFVVDILSGTSAGGINAVFLAKALANDQPFTPLKDLWIKEGDIGLLINDEDSWSDLPGLPPQPETTSLLNSQRMYYKLLEAIDSMEKPARDEKFKSPYVGELDLFVTATDLHGLPLPLPIGRQQILEYQYRAIFRFHYSTVNSAGKDSNDFLLKENPFLAFAARCTSSFPFAFEPMCFSDTEPVLQNTKFSKRYTYKPEQWKGFYKDYAHYNFPVQPFGDGGYLDNKPFGYATETLSRRRADLPVERKIIYIEPAPDNIQPENNKKNILRPDAIDNTLSATIFLPRHETIREDLKVIAERNEKIAKINEILQHLTPIMLQVLGQNSSYWTSKGAEWVAQYLDYSIQYLGPSYAFYHQLRVANTIKDLGVALARNLSLDENGASAQRLFDVMEKDWRTRFYATSNDQSKRKSENDLLYRLDMSYRLRRLQFIQQIINQLLTYAAAPPSISIQPNPVSDILRISKVSLNLQDPQQRPAFRTELQQMKTAFNDAYNILRDAGRSVRTRGLCAEKNPDLQIPEEYISKVRQLGEVLRGGNPGGTETSLLVEEISLLLFSDQKDEPGFIGQKFSEASKTSKTALKKQDIQTQIDPEHKLLIQAQNAAREVLAFYYDHFEFFDMVTYPILADTSIGESGIVEVIRISPQDAPGIINEKDGERKKLLGTKFGNFGAFFATDWRENDMLWGRLDGAECLINTVLSEDSPFKAQLLLKAQDAILCEDFLPRLKVGAREGENIPDCMSSNSRSALVEKFREYQVNGIYPPERIPRLASRMMSVLGLVLRSMEIRRQYLRLIATWMLRISKLFGRVLKLMDWLHISWR